jgi:RNA polymerase sigma-70 factor (ECF subfamily)
MTDPARAAFERGRAAWPTIDLDEKIFAAHLARTGGHCQHDADLYLACACAHGARNAATVFHRAFLDDVPDYIARVDRSPVFADDVRQRLSERLLLATRGELPRIAEFSGRGPLGSWVRVSALRIALNLKRERSLHSLASDDLDATAHHLPDAEMALLVERHRDTYRAALKAALAALSVRERTLLRMHVLDGFTYEALAGVYHVHRVTIVRWVQGAREKLIEETHEQLRQELQIGASELRSLTAVMISRLDVNLSGLFDR